MKSLWDFLAQKHEGATHCTRRWWAVFVEGAGNEEQPTDTHPEISNCAVWRRNCLSVLYLSPHGRLKINFESCHQKASRQWIHYREAKRHLQPSVIKSYPEATKPISPLQNSSACTKTSIFTQYIQSWGWRKKKSNPLCMYSRVSTALGIAPAGEMPESQGWHAGDGIVRLLGTSAPRRRGLGRREGFTSVLQNQGEAGNSQRGKKWWWRTTHRLATPLPALSNWFSQRIGGGNFTN